MQQYSDLLERARSAVTVEEECDVIAAAVNDAMPVWTDEQRKSNAAMLSIINEVACGVLPSAVLLGVVAAMLPEGWNFSAAQEEGGDGMDAWGSASEDLTNPGRCCRGTSPALGLLIAIREASHAG